MKNSTLTFLGRDSGFGENNNSAYIEIDNNLIIIDCGYTVFNKIKKIFDLKKYNEISVIITHLHNDHAGSLSQLILYSYFIFNKKIKVISMCKNIKEYLDITGVPHEAYELCNGIGIEQKNKVASNIDATHKFDLNENIKFIKTEHVKYMDSFGFKLTINNKNIVYTGDSCNIDSFTPYLKNCDEFYVDVSKYGGAHNQIDNVLPILEKIKNNGTEVYLMHIDDKEYISKVTNSEFGMD